MPKKFRYSCVYCLLHTIKLGILGRMCHYIQPNKHREITTYAPLYCMAQKHTNKDSIYPQILPIGRYMKNKWAC